MGATADGGPRRTSSLRWQVRGSGHSPSTALLRPRWCLPHRPCSMLLVAFGFLLALWARGRRLGRPHHEAGPVGWQARRNSGGRWAISLARTGATSTSRRSAAAGNGSGTGPQARGPGSAFASAPPPPAQGRVRRWPRRPAPAFDPPDPDREAGSGSADGPWPGTGQPPCVGLAQFTQPQTRRRVTGVRQPRPKLRGPATPAGGAVKELRDEGWGGKVVVDDQGEGTLHRAWFAAPHFRPGPTCSWRAGVPGGAEPSREGDHRPPGPPWEDGVQAGAGSPPDL